MLQALVRTITELLDSKKAAYSFLATAIAVVLHVQFGVSTQDALLLVSPLALATAAQAHVDARQGSSSDTTTTATTVPAVPIVPAIPAPVPPIAPAAST